MSSYIISATLFYGFYFFARQANEFCLVFLCVGVFLFFWGMTTAVTTIRQAEAQQFVWRNVDDKTRQSWRDRWYLRQKLEEQRQKPIPELEELKNRWAAEDKARRRQRAVSFIKMPVGWTLPLRQRIGWVTRDEQARIDRREAEAIRLLEELGREVHNEHISKISEGKSSKLLLEGTDFYIHEVGAWKYLPLQGRIDSDKAREILAHMQSFQKDKKGKLKCVAVIIGSSTDMSVEAKQILQDAGIEFAKPNSSEQAKEAA